MQKNLVINLNKILVTVILLHFIIHAIIESLVQSGHAEIEANKILYIYGNALEVL